MLDEPGRINIRQLLVQLCALMPRTVHGVETGAPADQRHILPPRLGEAW
jgi:hypothetical protein